MLNHTEAPTYANLDQVMRNVRVPIGRILENALTDQDITPAEAIRLFETQGGDLRALIASKLKAEENCSADQEIKK